ncbi:MAG: hypothetical protein HXY20_10040 [Acidobacteria bacterium]|nr:hypothetical protein [Acidobacteriota bacterium]
MKISSCVVRELRTRSADAEIIPLEQAVFVDDKLETPKEENAFGEMAGGEHQLDFILVLADTRNDGGVRDPSLYPYC